MGKDWSYSRLTKKASENGGPEQYIRDIATHYLEKGFNEGIKEGFEQGSKSKNPLIVATSAGVGIVVWGITYLVTKKKTIQEEYEKHTVSQEEAEMAHEELLREFEMLEKENETLKEQLSENNYID